MMSTQLLVLLQDLLHLAGDGVVLEPDDVGRQNRRGRVERVDGRVDPELGDGAREHRGGVEVGERRGGRRVGEVVGGDVDRLHRGDRALVRRRDPLLQLAHVRGERRLVTDGRRDAAEERRHLGARLGEAEDVVDEEQHVLPFLVAEVLGDGEGRQRDAGAGARRLVHLAVDEGRLREHRRAVGELRLRHLVVEVAPLAGALADAAEHREAAVLLGDVVDELEHRDGLADAGAAEEADLAAAAVGGEEVDDLDAGLEHLDAHRLVDEHRRRAVDRQRLLGVDRAALVDGERRRRS